MSMNTPEHACPVSFELWGFQETWDECHTIPTINISTETTWPSVDI